MTCTISGIAGLPSGVVYPSAVFTFTRLPKTVLAQGGRVVSPSTVTATSDGTGAISFSLLAGNYAGSVNGVRFSMSVPETATANFQDCVSAATVTPWPEAVQTAIDARDAAAASATAANASAVAAAAYVASVPVKTFATRSSAVTYLASNTPSVGTVIHAGGIAWRYIGSGTMIADMAGCVPDGVPTPDHYKENVTPGTTDMTAAFQTAMTNHRVVYGVKGSTYLVKGICTTSWDGAEINFEGCTINANGWDVGDASPSFPDGLITAKGVLSKTTTMAGTAAEGATAISVSSATGMSVGDAIYMISSTEHWYTEGTSVTKSFVTQINSISGTTIGIADALPFGFDTGISSVSITTWSGLKGVNIAMGTMIGPGYLRPRGNGPGENAICVQYCQDVSVSAQRVTGFQGRSISAQRCYDVRLSGTVQGWPDGYQAVSVENDNAYFTGFVVSECRKIKMDGFARRVRHAVDGIRAWDCQVSVHASDTHQSAFTSHNGCSEWHFDGITYSGLAATQGLLLWRGWNFRMSNSTLINPESASCVYDTAGAAADLPKTYQIINSTIKSAGIALYIRATCADVKVNGSVIKGGGAAGVAPITIETDRLERLDIVGNSIEAVSSNYAITGHATPAAYRNWRITDNNFSGYVQRAAWVRPETSQTMLMFRNNMLRPSGTPSDHLDYSGTWLHLINGPNFAADGKIHAPLTAWSPVVSDGTNDATMSGSAVGWYRREGAMVYFWARVIITAIGSVTGSTRVKGLPFACNSAIGQAGSSISVSGASGLTLTSGQSVTGQIAQPNNYISMQVWNAASGIGQMQATAWGSAGSIIISGCYPAA